MSREKKETIVEDGEGATPLILAAIGGHLKITQLLIGLGANLNHQDKAGHEIYSTFLPVLQIRDFSATRIRKKTGSVSLKIKKL